MWWHIVPTTEQRERRLGKEIEPKRVHYGKLVPRTFNSSVE
jgi:hypothetical protein